MGFLRLCTGCLSPARKGLAPRSSVGPCGWTPIGHRLRIFSTAALPVAFGAVLAFPLYAADTASRIRTPRDCGRERDRGRW